jgi:site-specific recombinase XerD
MMGAAGFEPATAHRDSQPDGNMIKLKPMSPSKAVSQYLTQRERGAAEATVRSHQSRLKFFEKWCDYEGIDNLNELTGRDLHTYRLWRRDDGDLSRASEKTQMDTLRVFIRWCESIEAVREDLSQAVQSPTLTKDDARNGYIPTDRAEAILSHLEQYDYASNLHCYAVLLWHCGFRVGATRALDLDDVDQEEKYIDLTHRPDTGTPIKGGKDGERYVAINDDAAQVIRDYIEMNRKDAQDVYKREPLITTRYGRPHIETLRKRSYGLTRPCEIGKACPHGKSPDKCDAARDQSKAYECPSSKSPHPWRRGAITHWLSKDVPAEIVSDRFSVGVDVIDKHYDERSKFGKMEQRRDYLDEL